MINSLIIGTMLLNGRFQHQYAIGLNCLNTCDNTTLKCFFLERLRPKASWFAIKSQLLCRQLVGRLNDRVKKDIVKQARRLSFHTQ